jgi:hypothetical protein
MNTEKLNDWLQVIGLFGIIASLMFVGLEMQQAKQIAISNASQARTDASVEFVTTVSTDPVVRSASIKSKSGDAGSMTAEEQFAYGGILYANLMIYENIYHQYSNGFITNDRWAGTRNNIKGGLTGTGPVPGIRMAYDQNPALWSLSFRQLVEEVIDEIEAEKEGK